MPDTPAKLSRRWLAGVLMCTALGLTCVGVGDAASRAGHKYSVALAFFWLGLLLIFVPVAVRVLMRDVSLRERLSLILLLGVALYGVKILGSPYAFTFVDEYIHLRNTEDILRTRHLFQLNPLLPTAAYYPGLAAATAGLVDLTGLSTFVAGLLVIGAARILISACFFLVAVRVTRSSRAAAGASLVYMANPMFLFWSSNFSYEDLALPLAAFVIWWLGRTRREPSRLVPVVAVGAIAAVVITHHVSAFALTGLLAAWWLAERLTGQLAAEGERSSAGQRGVPAAAARPSRGGHTIGLMALVAGVGAGAWFHFVARPAQFYLWNTNLLPALHQLVSLLVGHRSLRHLYSGSGGVPAPAWYVLAGFAATALLLLGLTLGLRREWREGFLPRRTGDDRPRRGLAPMIVATAVAVVFPLTLLPRLTSVGGAVSARSSEYVFTGLGCVLGLLAVEAPRLRKGTPNRRPGQGALAGGRRTLIVVLAVTAIFVGELAIGVRYDQLLPESSHPQGFAWTVQPDVISAAEWARKHLGMNQRFGVDAVDSNALAAYGEQDPVSGGEVWPVFFAKTVGANVVHIIRTLGVRYIFVDWRMTRSRPSGYGNFYFSAYEPKTGVFGGPFPGAALRKFASTPCVRLVYHSGPIEIFDVSLIENGSCVPAAFRGGEGVAMRSWHLRAIAGTCLFALLAVGTAGIAVPQPVRVVLGVPLVFLLSGFAVVCAVLPGQQLSRGERLLASLGASLVMTICVAVLLAATPVGLSRTSFAIALGGITVAVSAYAWFRARVPPARQPVASRPHDDRGLAPKKLWSDAGDRPKIVGYVADGEHDEAAIVADDADRLADEAAIVADGVDRLADEDEAAPEQVAFFDRANAQPRAVEQVLIRSALPGKVVGRVAFFERREVRNLLAYLRVISDPEDEASLRRVLNVPRRGIGGRTRECIAAIAEWDGMSFAAALAQPRDVPGLSSRAVRGIEAFNDLLAGLRADADAGMPVAEIAEAVLERSGYVAELEALGGAARVENLKELVTVAREFDALHEQAGPQDPETPGPAPGSLADFLAQVSLVADAEQPGGQGAEQ